MISAHFLTTFTQSLRVRAFQRPFTRGRPAKDKVCPGEESAQQPADCHTPVHPSEHFSRVHQWRRRTDTIWSEEHGQHHRTSHRRITAVKQESQVDFRTGARDCALRRQGERHPRTEQLSQSEQVAKAQAQEFYIALSTGEREQPALNTLIVAGSNRLMFDCEVVGETVPRRATALFLTHLVETTPADGIDRPCRDALSAPPRRISGPPGTREWIFQRWTVGHSRTANGGLSASSTCERVASQKSARRPLP
jgi:hypothetical protein